MSLTIALVCVAALLTTGPLALVVGRAPQGYRAIYAISLAASLGGLGAALGHLLADLQPAALVLPLGLPWLGAHFRLDALVRVLPRRGRSRRAQRRACSRSATAGTKQAPQRVLPFYPAFLAGMNLVVLADDAFTLPGLLGVHVAHLLGAGDGAPSRSATTCAPATSIWSWRASARSRCCSPSACWPGPDGGYAFDADPRQRIHPPALAALVLILALIGAGSKAGLVPLHVWLPLAHPAAPSHVSALMSGVMTKVAVYGFVRIVFDLLGPPAWWWSMVVLALGRHHLRSWACSMR